MSRRNFEGDRWLPPAVRVRLLGSILGGYFSRSSLPRSLFPSPGHVSLS